MTVSEQPNAARASSRSLFRIYQIGLSIAVFAFFGYESILGKTLAVAVLVSLLVAAIIWFMLHRARTGKDS
jgi:ribose/xylose/arabinose/galactoside ABC-type transport system permease subunit